jgi:hypothetical protein
MMILPCHAQTSRAAEDVGGTFLSFKGAFFPLVEALNRTLGAFLIGP